MLQDWTPQAATAAATMPWGILTCSNKIESLSTEMHLSFVCILVLWRLQNFLERGLASLK